MFNVCCIIRKKAYMQNIICMFLHDVHDCHGFQYYPDCHGIHGCHDHLDYHGFRRILVVRDCHEWHGFHDCPVCPAFLDCQDLRLFRGIHGCSECRGFHGIRCIHAFLVCRGCSYSILSFTFHVFHAFCGILDIHDCIYSMRYIYIIFYISFLIFPDFRII